MKVGAPIAILAGEGEDASAIPSPPWGEGQGEGAPKADAPTSGGSPSSQPSPPRGEGVAAAPVETPAAPPQPAAPSAEGDRSNERTPYRRGNGDLHGSYGHSHAG